MNEILKTDKRIRLGIWGLGRGSSFIKAARNLGLDIVAGCDCSESIRSQFAEICPEAKLYADENEFLAHEGMDAVLVATFFMDHADHAIRAMEAGYHVMSEVTSFFTPAQGVRLVEAVERTGKVYQLLENYPFMKENMYLQKLWQDGFFGEFQYGEFEYLHNCRSLVYSYNAPDSPPVEPGYTVHSWRSWLNFHYYNTHSLGPLMYITGLRPERITAFPEKIALPGYPESGMSKPCPSMIQMSNGAIMRNLSGSTTSNYHKDKRIWGTRAAAESIGHGLFLRIGADGEGLKIPVEPEWPELGEFADSAGHGGGDFWEIYYFARAVLFGEKTPWDIYSACDVTLAGIQAVRSQENNGEVMEIPDFRDPAVREKYRHDEFCQKPAFDPQNIFPAGHDKTVTEQFNRCMLRMEAASIALRKAFDGAKIYDLISDKSARLEVIRSIQKALDLLPDLQEKRAAAQKMLALYPECAAADALRSMMEIAEPEISDKNIDGTLKNLMKSMLEKE